MNSENNLLTNKFLQRTPLKDASQRQKEQFKHQYTPQHIQIKQEFPKVLYEKKTIVNIDSSFRDKNFYPSQDKFKTYLGRNFENVVQVKLVSTEIPNTDQVIKDKPVELQNNKMFWMNQEDSDVNYYSNVVIQEIVAGYLDITVTSHNIQDTTTYINIYNSYLTTDTNITHVLDGVYLASVVNNDTFRIRYTDGIPVSAVCSINIYNPVYSIECKPGNYTATTLAEELQRSFNLVKRRNQTGQYHYFQVDVNLDTDVMNFDSVITTRLGTNPLATTSGSGIITVNLVDHGLKNGDRVKIINAKGVAGILASTLSGDFYINVELLKQ